MGLDYTYAFGGKLTDTVKSNLEKLLNKHGITQKELAKELGMREPTISNYFSGKTQPKMDFFVALKERYHISIDDFLTREITPEELYNDTINPETSTLRTSTDLTKMCGHYFIYYSYTGFYKGDDYSVPDDSLVYGILSIYEDKTVLNVPSYSCYAVFGINDRATIHTLMDELRSYDSSEAELSHVAAKYSRYVYYGNISVAEDHFFIDLDHENSDKAFIILHRPKSKKPNYIGGIGTINSISRGRQHMPTIQFMGFSRYKLNLSPDEISKYLLLNCSNFNVSKSTDDLIEIFKSFYMDKNSINLPLDESQKKLLISSNIERIVRENISNNIMRYGKISEKEDDAWYHMIKHHMIPESEESTNESK